MGRHRSAHRQHGGYASGVRGSTANTHAINNLLTGLRAQFRSLFNVQSEVRRISARLEIFYSVQTKQGSRQQPAVFIHKSSKKLPKAALRNHRVRRPPLRPTNRPFQSSKWDPKFQVKPTSKRKDHNERPNSAPRGRIGRADCSRRVGRRPSGADRQPGAHRES